VSNIQTQQEILDAKTIRERLLAMLGMFFAGVALLLAAIGLYGVLNYSVLQRRREIGIRLVVGAQRKAIARMVTGEVFAAVLAGVAVGAAMGLGTARYIEALFYHVKSSDAVMLAIPSGAVFFVALFAMLPGVSRAIRIDPADTLRSE
jgi:putative ABC transport system permease protein